MKTTTMIGGGDPLPVVNHYSQPAQQQPHQVEQQQQFVDVVRWVLLRIQSILQLRK